MSDWFRNETWTPEIREFFFAKLKRARKEGRPQYLRIQAVHLIATKHNDLLTVAEELLNQLLTEYPDNRLEKASTLSHLGEIHEHRGNTENAIEYYRKAMDFERIFPNVTTSAYLHYSELIVKTNQVDKFKKVEKILKKRMPNQSFPLEKYKTYLLLAIIMKSQGETEKAKEYTEIAEQNAKMETSGFRYHKNLDLVVERELELEKILSSN